MATLQFTKLALQQGVLGQMPAPYSPAPQAFIVPQYPGMSPLVDRISVLKFTTYLGTLSGRYISVLFLHLLTTRSSSLVFSFPLMRWILVSDTVAVFPVLPRYYRGNGIEIHGSTAVMGLELTVFPR